MNALLVAGAVLAPIVVLAAGQSVSYGVCIHAPVGQPQADCRKDAAIAAVAVGIFNAGVLLWVHQQTRQSRKPT